MTITDYLTFQNQFGLLVGIAILVFIFSFLALSRAFKRAGKAVPLVISLTLTAFVSWRLYVERFYGYEETLAVILYIVVAIIFIRLLLSFARRKRR